MGYFFASLIVHCLIALFFFQTGHKRFSVSNLGNISSNNVPINNQKSDVYELKIERENNQPSQEGAINEKNKEESDYIKKSIEETIKKANKNITDELKIAEKKKQKAENQSVDKKKAPKENIDKNEKTNKANQTTFQKNDNIKNNNHKNNEQSKSSNDGAIKNSESSGVKGNNNGNGKKSAGDNAKEETQINATIGEIQAKIMQYWFPPEEFAARQDITVDVEISLDEKGNIISYIFLNKENTPEYKAVAASVLRVLNDPRIMPLPIPKLKNKNFNNLVLHFCPRDVI